MTDSKRLCDVKVVPEGKELVIREGRAPDIFVYEGQKYNAHSTEAFVGLVKSKASKENCVIGYTEDSARAILDVSIEDRPQDTVDLEFEKSLQAKEWGRILSKDGMRFDQKGLVEFLSRREPDEIVGQEALRASLENFKYVTQIQGDFSRQDAHNYTFMIKVGEAEGSVRLPKIIVVDMEIFKESGFSQEIEIELEFYKPKAENEKPAFRLSCPKFDRYRHKALEEEVRALKKSLDGYLVVAGIV